MKRMIKLAACCLAMCLFVACNGGITVKGENGQEYESYQECCAAQDFMAAHAYLAKMHNAMGDDRDKEREYQTAREYVFKQEALYLMSIGDDAAKKRIVYLLKEEGNNNNNISMLIDIAIDNDDAAFVRTLSNHYNSNVSCEMLRTVVGYLMSKDDEDNKEFVLSFINKYNKEVVCLIDYMAQLNNTQLSEFILATLSDVHIDGERPKVGRHVDSGSGPYETYQSCIQSYNQKCMKILDVAIKSGNFYLAKRTSEKIRTNYNLDSHWKGDYLIYNITEDNGDSREAKRLLNDAIRSGAFK